MKYTNALLILPLTLFSSFSFAQNPCSPSVPDDVCKIEQMIYTQTDFKNTDEVKRDFVALKDVIIKHDSDSTAIKEHILALFDQMTEQCHENRLPRDILNQATGKPNMAGIYTQLKEYENKNGAIVPLDWQMPEEILLLVGTNSRRYDIGSNQAKYSGLGLFGSIVKKGVVEQVQLIRYPNEVILDKQAGIGGKFREGLLEDAVPYFSFGGNETEASAKVGLYLLNIKIKNKPIVNGWFVLTRNVASSRPTVQMPTAHQVYHTNKPTFSWSNFKSPEFRSFEQRKRMVVAEGNSSTSDTNRLHFYQVNPDETQSIEGVFANGNYSFNISFEERWFFGSSMMLGRTSSTSVPFSVQK